MRTGNLSTPRLGCNNVIIRVQESFPDPNSLPISPDSPELILEPSRDLTSVLTESLPIVLRGVDVGRTIDPPQTEDVLSFLFQEPVENLLFVIPFRPEGREEFLLLRQFLMTSNDGGESEGQEFEPQPEPVLRMSLTESLELPNQVVVGEFPVEVLFHLIDSRCIGGQAMIFVYRSEFPRDPPFRVVDE